MQEQLPSSINHFQHTLNSYKTHHNGIFKNALSLIIARRWPCRLRPVMARLCRNRATVKIAQAQACFYV